MAFTQTNLTADLGANDVTMVVASGTTGFPAAGAGPASNYRVKIDNEEMRAISQPVAGTIKIAMRGDNGTAAAAHDNLAKVIVTAAPGDFPNPSPGNQVDMPPGLPIQQTIGESITFTSAQVAAWGNQPRVFAITKDGVAAIVLPAPSKAQDGLTTVWTSLTAQAHTLTATGLLADGATGSPEDLATWDPYIGATITLQAQNGLWNVIGTANGVAVS